MPLAEPQSSLEGIQESLSQHGGDEPEAGRRDWARAGLGKLSRAGISTGLGQAACLVARNMGQAGFH